MGHEEHTTARGGIPEGLLEDAELLEALFLAYSSKLRFFLRRRGARPGSIDDLVHETLLRAMDSIALFDRSKPVWPWLRTIAMNAMIADARKQSREVCLEDLDSLVGSAPEERCDDQFLDEALAAVPRRQRVALSLRYLDDWSPLEAASFMGVSRSTFDQMLSRGRRKLCIEYQRLRTRAQVIFLFPARWVRKITSDMRSHPLMASGGPTADSATQMWSAVVAATATVIIATGSLSSPAFPAVPDPTVAAANHQQRRTETVGERRPRTKTPAAPTADEPAPAVEGVGPTPSAPTATTPADHITHPNRNVKQPEDAEIGSIAIADDHTAYAAGRASCPSPYCPPVLFTSFDQGRTWRRAPALGLQGTLLAVPPGHAENRTIFAMGPEGLQISRDGGLSFLSLRPTGLSLATGSIAVSPMFDQGDPLVLVGAQTLMRYSDASGIIDPYAGSFHGPFDPAFSSSYANDRLFYLGAVRADGADGLRATVFTCHPIGCTYTSLPGVDQLPRLRTTRATGDEHVYAFTETDLFVSVGRKLRFRRLALPSTEGRLRDLRTLGDGALVAAVEGVGGSPGGIYLSSDGGKSWDRSYIPGHLGSQWIATSEDRILVALTGRGLICSEDGGRTFRRRCS